MADLSKLSDEQLATYRDMLAKRSTPTEPSRLDKTISNIPSSLIRTVTNPYGEGAPMPARENYNRGEYPEQFQDVYPKVKKFFEHPVDNTISAVKDQFTENPVGTGLGAAALVRGAAPEFAGNVDKAVTGGMSAAGRQVRPVLDKFSLWHPFKNIGLLSDAAKNTIQGSRDAVNPPVTSPFDVRPMRTLPSSGGMPFNPKSVEGGGGENLSPLANIDDLPNPGETGSPKLSKQLLKKTSSKETRSVTRPGNVGSGEINTPPSASTDIQYPNGMNPTFRKLRDLGKDTSGQFQGHPKVWARGLRELAGSEAETQQVRPVTRQGGYVPEAAANEPGASQQNVRPVIRDENGVPLMYSDTKAPDINQPAQEIRPVKKTNPIDKPYEGIERRRAQDEGKNPDDIFTKIANEGLAKRAADAKAKYEDIYNTHIKGQMSPDQVRSLATDPEARTQFDLKVKAMKHPEGHAKAGQKKYSSGINPDVIDHLASRLEAESPE